MADRMPSGFGSAGKSLWKRLVTEFEFGPHELAVLEVACRQADDVATLEKLIKDQGPIVAGSQGQPRLNAALTEVRQGRLALGRLLDSLRLPLEDEAKGMTPSSRKAQRAAEVRWARERRHGAA